ncbi:MAG: hypothetical protein O9353_07020 [Bacteroidia bacterium]|nr:hypothetical protein [Bacteroidia bacterium]
MNEKRPLAFKIFIVSFSVVISVILLSALFNYYQVDKKYSLILPILLTINSAMNPLGVYIAVKAKAVGSDRSTRLNKIGLIGNTILYVLFLAMWGLVAFARMR